MKVYEWQEVRKGLLKKGFKEEQSHHIFLVFHHNEKATTVRTRVSHGTGDIPKGVLSEMKKQLRLDTQKELKDLVDCPLSYEDYVRILAKKGYISR